MKWLPSLSLSQPSWSLESKQRGFAFVYTQVNVVIVEAVIIVLVGMAGCGTLLVMCLVGRA